MEDQSSIRVEHWHMKDFMPFMIRLAKESDRGAVLISTGYMEKVLKDILVAYLIEGGTSDALFDNGALATFSARAAACHALGLISDDEFHDIQLIRKIQNYLAHEMNSTFEDPQVVDRCKLLRLKAHDYGNDGPIPNSRGRHPKPVDKPSPLRWPQKVEVWGLAALACQHDLPCVHNGA